MPTVFNPARWVFSLRGIAVLLAVSALLLGRGQSAAAATVAPAPETIAVDLIARLNQARGTVGLPALTESSVADTVALTRAADMAANGYFAHVSPQGIGLVEVLSQYGVPFRAMGENIAAADYPAAQLVDMVHAMWMESAGHRTNMLASQFGRVGIAAVSADGRFYVVEIFLD